MIAEALIPYQQTRYTASVFLGSGTVSIHIPGSTKMGCMIDCRGPVWAKMPLFLWTFIYLWLMDCTYVDLLYISFTISLSFTHSHTHSHWSAHCWEFGVQWLSQEHFDMWTGVALDLTAKSLISGRPALPPYSSFVTSPSVSCSFWNIY